MGRDDRLILGSWEGGSSELGVSVLHQRVHQGKLALVAKQRMMGAAREGEERQRECFVGNANGAVRGNIRELKEIRLERRERARVRRWTPDCVIR